MKTLITLSLLYISSVCYALDVDNYFASKVDLSDSTAVLHSYENVLLGLSCISSQVGNLQKTGIVKLGDTIKLDKYIFKVGLIEVTKFNEDFKYGGNVIAKKGETVCVIAHNKDAMPSEEDCDALWVRASNCKVLQ